MVPDLLTTYACGEIEFRVYNGFFEGDYNFFIKAGAAGIELGVEELRQLFDLLDGIREDEEFKEIYDE